MAPAPVLAPPSAATWRDHVIGIDDLVTVRAGQRVHHVHLDNAASSPAWDTVADAVIRFLPSSGSVHRGTGHRSRASTAAYEHAREVVGAFVGADPVRDTVILTTNTTDAISRLAATMPIPTGSVVLATVLEHHSNDLPWRERAEVVHVGATADGALDVDDLRTRLDRYRGRVAVLAVSGASNVTGVVQPVHLLAELVHEAGGRIVVDAAQLAPHRAIDIRPHDDPGHLDAVAFSAHKMYAPFGAGALVADRACFGARPSRPGGGTVRAVTLDDVLWADLPDREESGSPNVVGAVAMAAAVEALTAIGMDRLSGHEADLTGYAVDRLRAVRGLTLHGPSDVDRVGSIALSIADRPHALVAAVLADEHGVGVRSGCFCAHPYIAHLLGLDRGAAAGWARRAAAGDRRGAPGLVRLSLGCYNDRTDVDRAVDGLRHVAAGTFGGRYEERPDGSYIAPA